MFHLCTGEVRPRIASDQDLQRAFQQAMHLGWFWVLWGSSEENSGKEGKATTVPETGKTGI